MMRPNSRGHRRRRCIDWYQAALDLDYAWDAIAERFDDLTK
jgi:hypothetical protein